MILTITLLVAGFVVLIKGADFLVAGSSSVARKFGISNLAIGLTVVAFGTSTPELLVNIMSSVKGADDAVFGNIIGSNNFNLLFILGLAGLIYPLVVQRNTVQYEVPISLLAIVVLYLLVNDEMVFGSSGATDEKYAGVLERVDALILLFFFGLFLLYVSRTMKNTSDYQEVPVKVFSPALSSGMIILGLVMLVGGGKFVVDSALEIAAYFKLSEKIIGLTILAAGTSLPELASSAVAAYKKNTDIAIGNVIGSNIFNIFFILGITGMIRPIPYIKDLNFDSYVLMGSTVVLLVFMFTLGARKLDRWEAFLMFTGYIVYAMVLIGMETERLT